MICALRTALKICRRKPEEIMMSNMLENSPVAQFLTLSTIKSCRTCCCLVVLPSCCRQDNELLMLLLLAAASSSIYRNIITLLLLATWDSASVCYVNLLSTILQAAASIPALILNIVFMTY